MNEHFFLNVQKCDLPHKFIWICMSWDSLFLKVLFSSTLDSPQYLSCREDELYDSRQNRVLPLSTMISRHTYLVCPFVLHILDQILSIVNREKAAIVYLRAPTMQHPSLLLIMIPACRRIINCITRYRVAQTSWMHLDEADSLSMHLCRQIYWKLSELKPISQLSRR